MRRSLTAFVLAMLMAGPALAVTNSAGSLPPPVQPSAATAQLHQASVGQRVGHAANRTASGVGRAARATGGALGRAARWTGNRLHRAGHWTRDRVERIGK